ncbi:RHS repeat-associated core domain-containing protein [uncultured Psychroserpens sp.]|uniref:RHS repeat-associated core domain-containing protein n=1 Tax=uncultured Psychroserpens sp. TaxID=255436 RepID=UPI0026094197|nr:RHS repeat-associated core domain-containing protein [uncultured Psychroserpens sp.]
MRFYFTSLIIILFLLDINAQTSKLGLTNAIYSSIYGSNADPDDYPAASFPNIFVDLSENSGFSKKARLLSYLEFQDGISVLRREDQNFNVGQIPFHASIIKALIEAFNVPLITNGSEPYSDVNQNTIYYDHIVTAYVLGMLPNTSQLQPELGLPFSDTLDYIEFLEANVSTPTQSELLDIDNYFTTGIYNSSTLGFSRGIEQGVFNHYAKNSFIIPDRKMNLNFSHFYSTQMVEMPQSFYPIQPLGRGWSHTYNAYIVRENNVGEDSIDYYYIIWPDGTIDIYNEDENEYVTLGVYDEFDDSDNDRIDITKKNQVRYRFEKLDNDRNIYYLIEIEDPNGNEINIEYENAEEEDTRRIEEVIAPSGKRLEFEYLDDTDLIEKIEDPINRDIHFEYSGVNSNFAFQYPVLVAFEDAKNNNTTYQYYQDNEYEQYLMFRIDLPRGNQIEAEYDINGKLSQYQMNDDDPIEVNIEFDFESNTLTSEVQTPLPSGGMFTEDYAFNENGLVTDYSSDTDEITINYPSSGINVLRPTDTNLNGVDIEYDYDNNGNITRIDKENGDVVQEFDYDNNNNLVEYTDPEGNITEFVYDNDENLIEIIDAYNNSIFFTYDSHGQLLSQTNQEGITVNYTYENDGAVSTMNAPENISSAFTYDGINRLLERDDNGLISSYEYDDNDNITQMINSGGFVTAYDYDENDNLIQIMNANNVATSFTYDDEDRVIEEQFGNLVTQFDYGDEGYLEEITKPSGIDIDYDYDNDGRLQETATITDIDYNNRNLVDDITNAYGTMEFDYDNLNLLEKVTTVHGFDVEYDYTDTNQVEDLLYPSINGIDVEVDYQYDNKNRIWIVSLNRNVGSGNDIIAEYEYYDDDRIKWIDLGNNIRINYDYDEAGRLRFIQHENLDTNSVMYTGAHLLDSRGNITVSNDYFTPIPPGFNPGDSSNSINFSYSYDENNQITSAGGVSYNLDDDGNTINEGADISYTFDIDDRLTSYSDVDNTFSFDYNAYNQRVEAVRNGETTKYIRDVRLDNILVELDEDSNPIQYYVYSPSGMLLTRMQPNGDLHYYHGDIRGSTVMMTDELGNITHQYRYDDFGRVTRTFEPENDTNQFRYVGIYGVEYETNDLYYMRARYYEPSIGRFLSEDPIWHINLYPYADNNPISSVDPSGKAYVGYDICSSSSSEVKSLYYDGNYLSVLNSEGNTIYSTFATSGRGKYINQSQYQSLKNLGPIPEGTYSLGNDWDYIPKWRQLINIVNPRNGDWGDYNISLKPIDGNNNWGRNNFYLHGGLINGSAGCIDTGQNIGIIYDFIKEQDVTQLEVRY